METLLITLTIIIGGGVLATTITEELKKIRQEIEITEAKLNATIEHSYKNISYDIAGMTSEMRTFENNKMLQLKTYISKEIETVNRQNKDILEKLKTELAGEVKKEAWSTFNHYLLGERLHRLKEMERSKS